MGKKKPETLKNERIEEVTQIFGNIDAEKMVVVRPMIARLVNMEFYLIDLERQIDEVGFVETYQNGATQSGTKESTASRCYSTVVKNYNSIVRTLLSLLPESERKDADDGLNDFLHKRDG